jgi:hypothetical protein
VARAAFLANPSGDVLNKNVVSLDLAMEGYALFHDLPAAAFAPFAFPEVHFSSIAFFMPGRKDPGRGGVAVFALGEVEPDGDLAAKPSIQGCSRNSSNLKPAFAIKLRSVPRATWGWFGIDSVAICPGFVIMIWLDL